MADLISAHKMLLSSSLRQFTTKMFLHMNKTPYIVGEHHLKICDALDHVAHGDPEYRRLIINIAPRFGKTLLVSQMFIAYGLAINPQSKFIHLSYSGQLTMDNSMAVKDIVKSEYYQALFDARVKQGSDTKAKWMTEQGGGVYATSTLGQITGFGAGLVEKEDGDEEEELDEFAVNMNPGHFSGAIVIDDPIRPEDALSELVREKVNRRFETTIRNRVNSRHTPIIIIMQRLHIHDLCGYLNEAEPGQWKVLSLPALYNDDNGNECALWPFKHTVEELHKLRDINPWVFETQYMQNPRPLEGLLFPEEETVYFSETPSNPDVVFIQVDPADEGKDCYCSKVFSVKDGFCYNVETMYTEDRLELTVPRQKDQILRWKPAYVNIESNSAWRLVAKEIKEWASSLGLDSEIRRFSVHENKELRIFNEAPTIRNRFRYLTPEKQDKEYRNCMKEKHAYMKLGKNQKDDGVDCDAAASHWAKKSGLITMI